MEENPQSSSEIQRAEKPEFLTKTRFDEFDLPASVVNGLRDAGFIYCTPIQARTLPVSLPGGDVAGQAQTGTGKTAAFLVTLLTRLLALPEKNPRLPSASKASSRIQISFSVRRRLSVTYIVLPLR